MFTDEELNRLYRFCLSLTHDGNQAYDLLQSSLEKYIKSNKEVGKPMAYLFRTIRNQFIDEARKLKREAPTEHTEEEIPDIGPPSIDDLFIQKEELFGILEKLTPEERNILYLWAVEERSFQEISELLGTPRGTLLSRVHRIRKKVQSLTQAPSETGGK